MMFGVKKDFVYTKSMLMLFLIYLNASTLYSQVQLKGGVMSIRCQELFYERSEKIDFQNSLQALIQREQSLLKQIPEQRKSMNFQLEALHRRLRNEHYLASLQIKSMEEDIIRSGCPGLSLE